jgi:hypothetical protein
MVGAQAKIKSLNTGVATRDQFSTLLMTFHSDSVFVVVLFFCASLLMSPFDPHVLPHASGSPPGYFEGWFARVSDHTSNVSASTIFGVYKPAREGPTQAWAALLLRAPGLLGGKTQAHQMLIDPQCTRASAPYSCKALSVLHAGRPVVSDPDPGARANFTVRIGDALRGSPSALMSVDGDGASVEASLGGFNLTMRTTGPRLPWDRTHPDGPGPEGWVGKIGKLLPCHYYVQSFGSPARYEIRGPSSSAAGASGAGGPWTQAGDGLLHMEANYGRGFPDAWLWAQAVAPGMRASAPAPTPASTSAVKRRVSKLLRGGGGEEEEEEEESDADVAPSALLLSQVRLAFGPVVTVLGLAALRTPARDWSFRTSDADVINFLHSACEGWLSLNASTPHLGSLAPPARRLEVHVASPPSDFAPPIYFPNSTGFHNLPGSVESYSATAHFRAFEHGRLVAEDDVRIAALEFGGAYRADCAPHGHAQQ